MSGPTDVNPTPALPPLDELRRAVRHGVVDVARTLLEVVPSLGRASSASGIDSVFGEEADAGSIRDPSRDPDAALGGAGARGVCGR